MKKALIFCAFALFGTQAPAQTLVSGASPIPEDAETRFCYYDGRAYSRNAYIVVSGSSRHVQSAGSGGLNSGNDLRGQADEKLLHCTQAKDGVMIWSSEASIKIGD